MGRGWACITDAACEPGKGGGPGRADGVNVLRIMWHESCNMIHVCLEGGDKLGRRVWRGRFVCRWLWLSAKGREDDGLSPDRRPAWHQGGSGSMRPARGTPTASMQSSTKVAADHGPPHRSPPTGRSRYEAASRSPQQGHARGPTAAFSGRV
jgi:hypothetical protein